MADIRTVARLAGMLEFDELKAYFADAKENEYGKLARKLFTNPETLDPIKLAELRGFYKGIEEVLEKPQKLYAEVHRPKET